MMMRVQMSDRVMGDAEMCGRRAPRGNRRKGRHFWSSGFGPHAIRSVRGAERSGSSFHVALQCLQRSRN